MTGNLEQSIKEFFEFKRVQRLSETTLNDYQGILNKFAAYIGDEKTISDIDKKDIISYFALLHVSKKRAKNIFFALSSLWTWACSEGLCREHVLRGLKPPSPEKRVVTPLEQREVEALLASVQSSLQYERPGKRACRNRLPEVSALRDRAILLFLLDTGVRASELCNLRIKDIGVLGAYIFGKGAKERVTPLSETTREAIRVYLDTRSTKPNDYLFITSRKTRMTRDALRQLIERIARRAGVSRAHPHRFRHTFAINFLRNDGDSFALQAILGHETLDMVKRYLAIAKTDIQRAHAKASPVTRWGL